MEPKQNLSVGLLNDSFPPLIDGVAMATLNYAKILHQRGRNVVVAVPRVPKVKDNYPFPVVRYQSLDVRKLIGYTAGNPFNLPGIKKVADYKPTILHAHCPLASAFLARSVKEVLGVPMVLTYHTKYNVDFHTSLKTKQLQVAAVRILMDNVLASDEIWAVSEGAGKDLKSLGYQGDYLVMPNGVDMPKGFAPEEDIRKVRDQYSLKEEVPLLMFVGRMRWYKGVRLILDALREMKKESVPFRMIFVGEGSDVGEMKKVAEEYGLTEGDCTFAGAIRDRETLRAIYSCASLFLFPSTYDTNGLVVREAAASAVPSILIRGSCAAEGVTDGRNGFLAEENSESMTAVLRECLTHLDTVRQVGKNAQDEIYLSWEDSVIAAETRYLWILEQKEKGLLNKNRLPSDQLFRLTGDFVSVLTQVSDILDRFSMDIGNEYD